MELAQRIGVAVRRYLVGEERDLERFGVTVAEGFQTAIESQDERIMQQLRSQAQTIAEGCDVDASPMRWRAFDHVLASAFHGAVAAILETRIQEEERPARD